MPRLSQPARRGRLLISVTAVALLGLPAAAQAQTTADTPFQMLGRLIFGTGAAKVAINTPQAVTSLQQDDFDRTQPTTLAELFKGVPGIDVAGASARALGQAFNIRGIGNTEQAAQEERIKVTVDGAPKFFEQYRMGSFFGDLSLFKRVEVLRGPASSTLYGAGAIGGVVAFTTKDASDYLPEGSTHAVRPSLSFAGNGNSARTGVIFANRTGALETLAAINASKGSVMHDARGNDLPGTAHEQWSALVKGKLSFGNDNEQSLGFSYSRSETKLDDTSVAQTGGASTASFGTADIDAVDQTATLTYGNTAPDSAFWDVTVQLSVTDTAVNKSNFSLGAFCSPGSFQVLCESDFSYRTTALKLENRADLSAGNWVNSLVFGLQASTQDRVANSSLGALGFHPEGTDVKFGAYVQGEFVLNDRLTIIPGLRLDTSRRTPSDASVAAGASSATANAMSPKLAVMYQVNEAFGLFGSLSQTERMPTLDELYSYGTSRAGAVQVPSLDLENEQARSVEFGFTYQQADLLADGDSLQLKVTGFNNALTDLIAANTTGGPGSAAFININRARIQGAELEAAYDAPKWFANLALSVVNGKDRSTGLTLADTPARTATLTLGGKAERYNLTYGWRASGFAGITTASTTTSGPGYTVHDIFATWSPQQGALAGLDVSLAVENLFDEQYRNNLSLDNGPGSNAKLTIGKSFTW